MVTEQVKRIQVALRAAGFKRGDFRVRAEITRKRDRTTGMRYSEFGSAVATSSRRGVVQEVIDGGGERIVAQGMAVEVITAPDWGMEPFIAVAEPKYLGNGKYEEPRMVTRDLVAEKAEADRLRARWSA